MAITDAQKQRAEQSQWIAARENSPQVRLLAGPGTGKTHSVEKRVIHLLTNGATPEHVYVISFTRATCEELKERVQRTCAIHGCSVEASRVHISTMHSLALSILRRANMLISYPSTPIMLDNWEQKNVYDRELSITVGCTMTRAEEIRLNNNQNFRELFLLPSVPTWLNGREQSAVDRIVNVVGAISSWTLQDTLDTRIADIATILSSHVFTSGKQAPQHINLWTSLATALPPQMTLEELLLLLSADTDSDQEAVLEAVQDRIGRSSTTATTSKKVRILTMHGAKGLGGKVVFIPSCEQGIIPSNKSLRATGLLIEQRRLMYVSITRAMACCIISHSSIHRGAAAMALAQQPSASLPRSQFLNEMGVTSVSRSAGLNAAEARAIMTEVINLG